ARPGADIRDRRAFPDAKQAKREIGILLVLAFASIQPRRAIHAHCLGVDSSADRVDTALLRDKRKRRGNDDRGQETGAFESSHCDGRYSDTDLVASLWAIATVSTDSATELIFRVGLLTPFEGLDTQLARSFGGHDVCSL